MNRLMIAIAVAIALPGVAHAQAAPAEKPRMECCEKMKDTCPCCQKAAGNSAKADTTPSSDPHSGHDMTPAAPADGHAHH